jgi:uncharacterized protein (DUF1330 family)
MSKGYWIVRADVSDAARFSEYATRTAEVIKLYGGEFLARAGRCELVEGSTRARNTLIQFPSYADALNCWRSREYADAKAHREGAAQLDVVVIECI